MRILILFFAIQMIANSQTLPDSLQSIITNHNGYLPSWTPSKIQTDSVFQEVLFFLKTKGYKYKDTLNWNYNIYKYDSISDWQVNQIPMIYSLLRDNKYCVQFTGYYNKKKEKCMTVNFFAVRTDTANFYNSCNCSSKFGLRIRDKTKETLYRTIDGGYYYWLIDYNYKRKKCTNFEVNNVG